MRKKEFEQKVCELFEGCTVTHPSEYEIICSGGGLPEECTIKDRGAEGISVSFFNTSLGQQQKINNIYRWTDAYELLYMGLTKPDKLAGFSGEKLNALLGRKAYDFQWTPAGDIVDLDDHTLRNVITVLKHGFVRSLFYRDERVIVEGYESVYEADWKSQASWRRMVLNLLRKEQNKEDGEITQNHNCVFAPNAVLFAAGETPEDAGPDRVSIFGICGFLEYAYRNGALPRLLAERKKIRKDYRTPHGPFLFTWGAPGGLMEVPENVYQLAGQMVRGGLVSIEKELDSHNCVKIMAPDFAASFEKEAGGGRERTFSATAALVEERSTKKGREKYQGEPDKVYRTPIGNRLFESNGALDPDPDNVYFVAGYLQYLSDCEKDYQQLIEDDRKWYWQNIDTADQAWGDSYMRIFPIAEQIGDVADRDLELASRLQERNYVSLYPKVVCGEKVNQIYYAAWVSEEVLTWSGDKERFLQVVENNRIKHGPVEWVLLSDEFQPEQHESSQEILKIVSLAAYVDYLHRTYQYQKYMRHRDRADLLKEESLKEYPSLAESEALTDPNSHQSLYCIIQGGTLTSRGKLEKDIAEILCRQGKIDVPEPVECTFAELAQELYGEDILFTDDRCGAEAAFENPNELKRRTLYVLTKPERCAFSIEQDYSASKWEVSVMDYLAHYQPDRYYIVICKPDSFSADRFIGFKEQFKFLFQNMVITPKAEPPQILYRKYTEKLMEKVKEQLPDDRFESHFLQYIEYNRQALKKDEEYLVNYLADYANFQGRLALPEMKPDTLRSIQESVIGKGHIWKVMKQLHAYADFLKKAEQEHMDVPPNYLNMIFVGNPGTGKTLMTNYVARLLWEYDLITNSSVKTVDFVDCRNELRDDNTLPSIPLQRGGIVLVIEDIRDVGDEKFFAAAIADIVQYMDEHKGESVIILTGTPAGIDKARKACAKLSSRVYTVLQFEDYSAADMEQLFFIKAAAAGFVYRENEEEAFHGQIQDLCDNLGHRRHMGNGHFVDQLLERTIMNHAQRVPEEEDTRMLTLKDIPTERDLGAGSEPVDYEHMLNQFVGMESVKEKVREIAVYVRQQKLFRNLASENKETGKTHPLNMHMVFTGNPGTGKTTIARLMAEMLYSMGVLQTNQFMEVGREGLVGDHIGSTALKTKKVIEAALDGVLFVDEAYVLADTEGTSSRDFGKEAIATLIRAMEDYKDCLVVIFAGYTDEMRRFVNSNPGIASRIAYTINFPDYTPKELTEIFRRKMGADGYIMGRSPKGNVLDKVENLCEYFVHRKNFGNGRFIDKLMQETRIRHANNVALLEVDDQAEDALNELMMLRENDIPSVQVLAGEEEPEGRTDQLDDIIGLQKVKDQFNDFKKIIQYQSAGRERGVTVPDFHLHMVFMGNPGTGKTIMARLVKDELYQIGMIKENKLVEVEGKDLIAEHVGQTAPKTADVIDSAMGGVLFIDEAYSLSSAGGSDSSFGEEALATLVKAMEDHKDDLVIIFAGYPQEMENLLRINPGLSSRIGFTFTFEDYNADELTEMFVAKMNRNGFVLTEGAINRVVKAVTYFRERRDFGNGRFVDRLVGMAITNRARRFDPENPGKFNQIIAKDIPTIQDMGGRTPDDKEEEAAYRERVAVHEAGHALVRKVLEPNKKLSEIKISDDAVRGGYVAMERHLSDQTESALKNSLAVGFGGRNAENLIFGDHAIGCSQDMETAFRIAQDMVDVFAMGTFGETEPMDFLKEADQKATEILTQYKEELLQIKDFLLSKKDKVIPGDEFEEFYRKIHKAEKSL